MILSTIIIFIIVLGILVFVHELGHFVIAKKAGMEVEEFGFGFPPRIKGFKYKGTIYSINWIPLGGFVKILGENGENASNPKSFASKSAGWRFAVLIAGVTMNILLAVVLLSVNSALGTPTLVGDPTEIGTVSQNSPAHTANLKTGDKIVTINNLETKTVADIQKGIQENTGKEVTMQVSRNNNIITTTLTPRKNPPQGQGAIGIQFAQRVELVKTAWYKAPIEGVKQTAEMTAAIGKGLTSLIANAIKGQKTEGATIAGPIGIASLTKQASDMGIQYLLQFMAMLSINLAILNILPLPALDGGRIIFVIIEKVKGSPVKKEREGIIHMVGFLVLIGLMLVVTGYDLWQHKDSITNLFN